MCEEDPRYQMCEEDEKIPIVIVDKDGNPLDEKTLKLLDELGENNMKDRREHPELYEEHPELYEDDEA